MENREKKETENKGWGEQEDARDAEQLAKEGDVKVGA